jgi:hypothetical protein
MMKMMNKEKLIVRLLAFFASFLFLSCEEIVLEDDISEEEIVLVAPQDNAQFNTTTVNLNWEPVQYAKKYHIQIAKPDFNAPSQILVDTEVTTLSYTAQLNIGTYQWRVRAISGSTSTPYKTRTITIANNSNFQDNVVMLTSPANNFITKTPTQNLTWQAVIGATNYQLQIYDNTNTIVTNQTLSATNFNYSFPDGSFTWRVRASNGSENTLYSSNSILVDTVIPNTPTLTAPANASNASGTSVTFTWSRTNVSGSAEYDKIYIYKNIGLTDLHSETQATSGYNTTLTSGTYYWFVKGFDVAGNEGNRSAVYSLIIN